MKPSMFYLSTSSLRGDPSPREAEAMREARIAEIRALIAEIAAPPRSNDPEGRLARCRAEAGRDLATA
jgi:hypothetical protein